MEDEPTISVAIGQGLDNDEPEARRRAASHIADLEKNDALPLLLRGLGDPDWRVRKESANAAAHFVDFPPLIEALVRLLHPGDNVGLRNCAVDVLARLGEPAVVAVAKEYESLDPDGKKLAVEVFGRAGTTKSLNPLRQALSDEDTNVREAAAEAIASLGTVAPDAVREVLVQALEDDDIFLKLAALQGLTRLGAPIPWQRLEPLMAHPLLRSAALAAAARLDRPEQAATTVVEALATSSGSAFDNALRSISELIEGPAAESFVASITAAGQPLVDRLLVTAVGKNGESPADRGRALCLCAVAASRGLVPIALRSLEDELMADHAQRALSLVGPEAIPELLRPLIDVGLSATPPDTKATAIEVVTSIIDQNGRPEDFDTVIMALRRATRETASSVATTALYAVSRLGDASDLSLVAELADSDSSPIAHAAERALATLSRRHVLAATELRDHAMQTNPLSLPATILIGALISAPDAELDETLAYNFLRHALTAGQPRMRSAAVSAVAELGGIAAGELLGYALADEDDGVKRSAARAVGLLVVGGDHTEPALSVFEALNLVAQPEEPELLAITIRAIGEQAASSHETAPTRREVDDTQTQELVSALAPYANEGHAAVAVAALDALARLSAGKPAKDAMARALGHPDIGVGREAMRRLEQADRDRHRVIGALKHVVPAIRLMAVEVLADSDPEIALEPVIARAAVETDRDVRFAIDLALAELRRRQARPDSA